VKGGLVAFCFPGQGSLDAGMGREIAAAVPDAMDVFERSSEAAGLDLRYLCFEAPEHEVVQTEVQQPALVATSLAVLAAIKARGIKPDFVVGHSVGELTAAAVSGALSATDAVRLAALRGAAMKRACASVDGGMVVNELLMQFQADILNREVVRPVVQETTALGAAYAAGLAVGFFSGLDELRAKWAVDRIWKPALDETRRAHMYKQWKKAVERSFDWADSQERN